MQIETLEDMSMNILKATYFAEEQITKALPKMMEAATNPELKQAFAKHLQETSNQIQRLDRVFDACGQAPEAKTCPVIKSMIESCEEMINKTEAGPVRDAGLIFFAQGVEHYEMAHYGTLIAWAQAQGETESVFLLQQTLTEEKNTDQILNRIGESNVNNQAAEMARAA